MRRPSALYWAATLAAYRTHINCLPLWLWLRWMNAIVMPCHTVALSTHPTGNALPARAAQCASTRPHQALRCRWNHISSSSLRANAQQRVQQRRAQQVEQRHCERNECYASRTFACATVWCAGAQNAPLCGARVPDGAVSLCAEYVLCICGMARAPPARPRGAALAVPPSERSVDGLSLSAARACRRLCPSSC